MKRFLNILFSCLMVLNQLIAQDLGQPIKVGKIGLKPMCASEDGDTLYMAYKKSIYALYVPTGRMIKKIKIKTGDITSIANAAETPFIVVAGNSLSGKGKLVYLNRQTLREIKSYDYSKRILAFSVSDNGEKIAVSSEKKIRIYALLEDTEHKTIETGFHSLALNLSEDGKWLAYGGSNKRAVLVDLESDKEIGSVGHADWVRKADIGNGKKFMVSAGDDESVYISYIREGNLETSILSGHRNRIYALKISPDDRYIVSGSKDQSYIIWDSKSKQLVEKHELKSKGTLSDLVFASNCKQLVISPVLHNKLSIQEISHLNIIPRKNIMRNREDKDPPQIYVSSPEKVVRKNIITYKDPFPITGTVVDESGLRKLSINGAEIPVRENGNFAQFMPLAYGDNPIVIEAIDVNENISVKKFTLIRKSTHGEIPDTAAAKNFLLAIGINKYQNWPELNNAVNDANSVIDVLLNKYNFQKSEATVLLNEEATRNNIYRSLRKYIELVGPNDNLLIYYAGHGYFDDLLNEGYWIPVDAVLGEEAEYLPNTTILKIIGNINSKHTFLVADACFSGSLFAERERGYTENVERYKSRWGLASGRLEEVSDGSGKHSPFAGSFVKCLTNTEKNKIAASEIIQYVKENVSKVSPQTPRGSPLKNVGDEGGEFVFRKK